MEERKLSRTVLVLCRGGRRRKDERCVVSERHFLECREQWHLHLAEVLISQHIGKLQSAIRKRSDRLTASAYELVVRSREGVLALIEFK